MRIPDAKSLRLPWWRKNDRALSQMGISQLQSMAGSLEENLEALENLRENLDNPSYKWLVEKFLPAERRRISDARSEIQLDEKYRDRQLVIDGQIAQIDSQIEKLTDIEQSITMAQNRLNQVNQAIKVWANRNRERKITA